MIELDSVSKRYADKEALTTVSLRVKPQQILALAGPSGSGKSTLLRLVAGLERPDTGLIVIDGRTVSTPELTLPPRSRGVALIFQELALWPHMTVRGHLQFVLNACRADRNGQTETAVEKLTAIVGLAPHLDRYPHQLSGGEQQRLAIARALAQRPSYLLMDEPFSNLDPLLKEELIAHIGELVQKMKLGVVHVTHNMYDLVQTAHDVAVLHQGQLLQAGERDAVYKAPRNELVKKLLGA